MRHIDMIAYHVLGKLHYWMKTPSKSSEEVDSTADLAAKLGLSRWAVSRALNGRPGISKATAARVRAAMQEHHFEPDPLARGLRGGATGMVAICLPRQLLEASVPGELGLHPQPAASGLRALCNRLEENGLFSVLVTSEDVKRQATAVRRVLAIRADALILVCPRQDGKSDESGKFITAKTPCIAIDPVAKLPCTAVKFDRVQAARLSLLHLQNFEHKRFALLGMQMGSPQYVAMETAAADLGFSWRNQMRVLGIDDLPSIPVTREAFGWAMMDTILRRKIAVTGLIAADDTVAAGALARLQQEGKNAPADFSLIGGENLSLSGICNPAITTVDPQATKLFELAADTLCAQMRAAGQIETQEILVHPLFLKRASTGPARV